MISSLSMNPHMGMREEKHEPQRNGRSLGKRMGGLVAAIIIG